MIYIKLNDDMSLSITQNGAIYRGDHMNEILAFLIPVTVQEMATETTTIYASYIRADGTADIALLNRDEAPYNDGYYTYRLPVTTSLSRYAGEVCLFLSFFSGPPRQPVVAKSGECVLHVLASTEMDEYIPDRSLRLIYEMQRHMEDKVEQTEKTLTERIDKTDETVAAKADNIVFDKESSTIRLVSTVILRDEDGNETGMEQVPLGDPIFVRADTSRGIDDMEINSLGELVVTFDDGTTQNLGNVVGGDGAVYVPHIDAHKVLTFTLEPEPTEPPAPIDLVPSDDWSGIDDSEVRTDYVWESL